ncbi:MAG TPA: hypothetical protein VK826_18755, partial [Bacteroidia bacterium]|nr:hypothetical protein [Bacteroidia bacterium]
MRSLTDEQIDVIADDIRIRGVFTQSLQEDLLDHICCFIEEQPDDERPFEEIYRLALDAFGQKGLQGVQDETLYLINQPYLSTMKKFAYITGSIASVSLVAGALFKIMHWPGASFMLILGTLVLSMFFIPYFFYVNLKEQTEKKSKVIAALGLLTALFLCAGALFKLMHWPGAIVLIGGFGLFFLIFLPLYIINGVRNPLTKVSSISNGFLFAAIGGFVMLMSFQQPSKTVTDSIAIIETNQDALLKQLRDEAHSDSISVPVLYALDQFVQSCDNALDAIPQVSPNAEPDRGMPVSAEDLSRLNEKIIAAVKKLNT